MWESSFLLVQREEWIAQGFPTSTVSRVAEVAFSRFSHLEIGDQSARAFLAICMGWFGSRRVAQSAKGN
jgi:hypothetical protein